MINKVLLHCTVTSPSSVPPREGRSALPSIAARAPALAGGHLAQRLRDAVPARFCVL